MGKTVNTKKKEPIKKADSEKMVKKMKTPQSDVAKKADKYDHQRRLAAERQKRFKARMTDEQLELKRKRDRERYHRLKDMKKIKPITEMKAKEQRQIRTQWKLRAKAYRDRKKAAKEVLQNTPPSSDEEENGVKEISRQKAAGRKVIRRDRSAAYRKIKKQDELIKTLKRKVEKYKKRASRAHDQNTKKVGLVTPSSPSPTKQVQQLVANERVSPNIRKRLILSFAFEKQIQSNLKLVSPKSKERQIIHKVLGSKIVRKYRLQNQIKNLIPYKKQHDAKEENSQLDLTYTRKKYCSVSVKEAKTIREFYENDLVSKMCPGKKDFVRRGKAKKQRRILLDTLKTLYAKFLVETEGTNISYSTFVRCRPFWVTSAKSRDRETCACETHENFEFLVMALKQKKVIKHSSADILKYFVCSTSNEKCMTNTCQVCNDVDLIIEDDDNHEEVKFFKWKRLTEVKNIKGIDKKITRVVKTTETCKLSELLSLFKTSFIQFKKHVFHMHHQAKELKNKKKNLTEDELIFHVDFSQNYVTKCVKEIQAMHFGASKRQISLHTGVRYSLDGKQHNMTSFCTCSDHLDHHAYGVWAHLEPILKESAEAHPNVHTIHFFSDSPSSQYRNRANIYLLCKMLPKYFCKMQNFTWNYSEHGHGKGAMDGVGGSIKRNADQHVLHGKDITCAKDLVEVFKYQSKTLIKEVLPSDVERFKKLLPNNKQLPECKGIMQVRQLAFGNGKLNARRLSCFQCKSSEKCQHFHLKELKEFTAKTIDITNNMKCVATKKSPHLKCVDKVTPPKKKKTILKVTDVYSSSSEDENYSIPEDPVRCNPHKLSEQGSFVVVKVQSDDNKRTKKSRNFVAVVQSDVNVDVKVMFMKACTKDRSMFYADESDTSYISDKQIVGVLPTPNMVVKGHRIFYKFKRVVEL